MEGMADSLERLQLDYVDIAFCHRPDFSVPVEETVHAFNTLIAQGKCLYWGTSEWPAQRIQEAITVSRELGLIGPVVEQPQYSMLHRTRVEREYAPLYDSTKLGLTIWSPLASGLLTGKYLNGVPEGSRLSTTAWLRKQFESGESLNGLEMQDVDKINERVIALGALAEKYECTRSQLAIAWCLKNQNVSTVITGASKVEQVVENLKSLEIAQKLNATEIDAIENILKNNPGTERDYSVAAREKQQVVAEQRRAAVETMSGK
jgi:aryl-alcohol dehydrogenase-like predicted oxidoreductase